MAGIYCLPLWCHSSFFCKQCSSFFGEPVLHQIIYFFLFSSGRADSTGPISSGVEQYNTFFFFWSQFRDGQMVNLYNFETAIGTILFLYHWTGNWKDIKPVSAEAHSIRKILQSMKLRVEKETKIFVKIEIYEDIVERV